MTDNSAGKSIDSLQGTPKKAPRRGGLGRGLGALIPSAQEEDSMQRERPMDVLFPQRQPSGSAGAEDGGARTSTAGAQLVRGGSARDLLSPRSKKAKRVQAPANVSRETISSDASAVDNVSRETLSAPVETDELLQVPGASFGLLPLEEIIPNTRQPRQVFEQSELDELAASILEVGVLQPIVVRPVDTTGEPSAALIAALELNPLAKYELIMGERRLRASELAGIEAVPAIVRHTEDEQLLRDALLENLHRVQLNPLEEAAAYEQLLEDFSCTQEDLAKRVARSRPQIANTLRLLKLPPTVQRKVAAAVLSAGHARALLGLASQADMEALAQRIVAEGLSVRATEEIVRFGRQAKDKTKQPRPLSQPSALAMQVMGRVSGLLDTQVTVTEGKKKGKIVIDFADEADLARISQLLGGLG